MQPLSRVTADELSSLVMENELLRYEITHVRARLAAAEKALERSRRDLDELKTSTAADGGDQAAAREDLVWLLTRLDASPLGRVLRRRPRVAELRRRYLPEART
jgi:chromosome segregation ATPase